MVVFGRNEQVIDHLGEGNGDGERGPFSYDVWYEIPPIISLI